MDLTSHRAALLLTPFAALVAGIHELAQVLGVRRSSVVTAACALQCVGCDVEGSEGTLDGT